MHCAKPTHSFAAWHASNASLHGPPSAQATQSLAGSSSLSSQTFRPPHSPIVGGAVHPAAIPSQGSKHCSQFTQVSSASKIGTPASCPEAHCSEQSTPPSPP